MAYILANSLFSLLILVFSAFYLFLPAGFANMAPVFFRNWVGVLAKPLDFGLKINGVRIFGDHKTFRGLIFGIIFAEAVAFIQFLLYVNIPFFSDVSFIMVDYNYWYVIGFLLGFGAIIGDAVKSFFKRRCGIKPGESFFPYDQIDFSIGAILFLSIFRFPGFYLSIVAVVLYFFLHIVVNWIGFLIGMRDKIL